MLKDFKEFAMRGNVVDLAVGVIIGSAFGKIVSSLVNDVIMPPLGLVLGNVDFSNLYINLSQKHYPSLAAAKSVGAPVIGYGQFLNTVIEFLIIAFVVFLVVKTLYRLHREEKAPTKPTSKDCPFCLSKIPPKATRCPQCTSQLKN